jgi:hypothetical protein
MGFMFWVLGVGLRIITILHLQNWSWVFLGGCAFFVANGFYQFFCASKFCLLETFLLLVSNLRVKFGALRGKESAVRAHQLPAGCNVEHILQNGFRTVFGEVMGTGRWDRRVHDDFLRGTIPLQTNFGCSEAHRQSPL